MVLLNLVSVGVDLVEVMLSVSSVNGFGQNVTGTLNALKGFPGRRQLTPSTGGPGGSGDGIVRQAGQLVRVLGEVRHEPVVGAAAVTDIVNLLCMCRRISWVPCKFNFMCFCWCWRRYTLGPCWLVNSIIRIKLQLTFALMWYGARSPCLVHLTRHGE
jgi:hypothetical protein